MTTKSTKSNKSTPAKSPKARNTKSASPKPSPSSHVPTPWAKLRKMWEAGKSYEAMAKATDAHYDPKKTDPMKPTRAKIWKARNIGVKIDGKLVRFGARGKVKAKPILKKNRSQQQVSNKKANTRKMKPDTTGQVEVEPQQSTGSDLEQK